LYIDPTVLRQISISHSFSYFLFLTPWSEQTTFQATHSTVYASYSGGVWFTTQSFKVRQAIQISKTCSAV